MTTAIFIPNAFENAAQIGNSVVRGPMEASLRLRQAEQVAQNLHLLRTSPFDSALADGRLSRVVEPRTFRSGAKVNF